MATKKNQPKKRPANTKLVGTRMPVTQIDKYTFYTFHHPHTKAFIKELNKLGVKGLLKRKMQQLPDVTKFKNIYGPTDAVTEPYPLGDVDFTYSGAYSLYNWELFYHVPMLIATKLTVDQRFEEARHWFHCIFDPTISESGNKERFWQFKPFYDEALKPTITTLNDLLHDAAELQQQIAKWERNPFRPHVIARMRINAYMKTVVIKYLDNLIAWGDQLFRRDTIESINEATNLYILAWEILGEKPQSIPPRAKHAEYSFDELKDKLDSFTLAMVDIETFISPSASSVSSAGSTGLGSMFNFCVPRNEFLLRYWDLVADRLFKIRHSMNIEGVTRTLPLYEPPIDPALLVRAAAAGIDLNSILSDISSPLPNYRFSFMLQKANELVNDVKSLGSSLLQALEKRDAETMSLLRSGHEQKVLSAALMVRQKQIDDAQAMLESAEISKENTSQRFAYYSTREFMNTGEKTHLASVQLGMILSGVQGGMSLIGGLLAQIPDLKAGSPFSLGATYGGSNLSFLMKLTSDYLGIIAGVNSTAGGMASTIGGYQRRMDDWQLQARTADKEMQQSVKQVLSAQIKLAIAEKELENHQLQIDNAAEMDEFMRSKFTNEQLYDWMVSQLSSVYFQSYQLAYDLAKKAEQCYRYELGEFSGSSFIQFGYWDSLKKGLLSAEKLQYDLRRLESSYLEKNKRQLELTKHISLVLLDPGAIISLRANGTCSFTIPEALFDLDFPGHYFRRIKSISISIPCIAGPYTTISGTLRLVSHTTRIEKLKSTTYSSTNYSTDKDFRDITNPIEAPLATSNAQNDSGVFELNFRDERYLPFEGCGAFGKWQFDLNTDPEKLLRLFDYNTISDLVLHIKYTAMEDENMILPVQAYLKNLLQNPVAPFQLWRAFSCKQDFPNDWYKGFHPVSTPVKISFTVDQARFPLITKEKNIEIIAIHMYALVKVDDDYEITITITPEATGIATPAIKLALSKSGADPYHAFKDSLSLGLGKFDLEISRTGTQALSENDLKDLILVVEYRL